MKITKNMINFIQKSLEFPFLSDAKIGEMIDITPAQICRWRKDDTFKAEYDKALHEQWESYTKEAQMVMHNILINGNEQNQLAASKYLLDSVGYKPTDKVNINADASINVSIDYGDDSDEC